MDNDVALMEWVGIILAALVVPIVTDLLKRWKNFADKWAVQVTFLIAELAYFAAWYFATDADRSKLGMYLLAGAAAAGIGAAVHKPVKQGVVQPAVNKVQNMKGP